MPIQKVQAGDPLRISAEAYNAFVDAAKAIDSSRMMPRGYDQGPDIVTVVNNTGAQRERFDIVGLSDLVIKPTDNLEEFQTKVVMTTRVPLNDDIFRFAIMLEPVAQAATGHAVIQGITACKLSVSDAAHRFAAAQPGQCGYLISADKGGAEILWTELGTGVKWAVVRIAGGGGVEAPQRYARIVAASGTTPPYVYSGQQVSPGQTPGTWVDVVPGDDLAGNGFCLREQGRPGAAKLPAGTVVLYRLTTPGWWTFDANGWPGTYG